MARDPKSRFLPTPIWVLSTGGLSFICRESHLRSGWLEIPTVSFQPALLRRGENTEHVSWLIIKFVRYKNIVHEDTIQTLLSELLICQSFLKTFQSFVMKTRVCICVIIFLVAILNQHSISILRLFFFNFLSSKLILSFNKQNIWKYRHWSLLTYQQLYKLSSE